MDVQGKNTPVPGGLLVAIEGIDGAGKTTLVAGLKAELIANELRCVSGKEPTQGPWGRQLRESASKGRMTPERELELLLLDREEHVREFIAPELAQNSIVLLDRYYFSNIAYQGAEGLDVNHIRQVNEAIAPLPDLLLLLDLPSAVGLQRIAVRGDSANAFETTATLDKCRQLFLEIESPVLQKIDATRSAHDVLVTACAHLIASALRKIQDKEGLSLTAVEAGRLMFGEFGHLL